MLRGNTLNGTASRKGRTSDWLGGWAVGLGRSVWKKCTKAYCSLWIRYGFPPSLYPPQKQKSTSWTFQSVPPLRPPLKIWGGEHVDQSEYFYSFWNEWLAFKLHIVCYRLIEKHNVLFPLLNPNFDKMAPIQSVRRVPRRCFWKPLTLYGVVNRSARHCCRQKVNFQLLLMAEIMLAPGFLFIISVRHTIG